MTRDSVLLDAHTEAEPQVRIANALAPVLTPYQTPQFVVSSLVHADNSRTPQAPRVPRVQVAMTHSKRPYYAPRTNEHIPHLVVLPHKHDPRKSRAPQQVLYTADISTKDRSAIARAISAAKSSEHHKYRVGAAVLVSGRIVSASNRFRNAPHEAPPTEQSVHAEVRAVLRAYSRGRGGIIYVARLGARGRLLPSHPCARCMPVLMEAGIKRVVWFDGLCWRSRRLGRTA